MGLDEHLVELVARGVQLGFERCSFPAASGPGDDVVAVSLAEAGRRLGISEDTVARMIDTGALPGLTWGRRRTVPVRAIDLAVERAMADFHPEEVAAQLQAVAS